MQIEEQLAELEEQKRRSNEAVAAWLREKRRQEQVRPNAPKHARCLACVCVCARARVCVCVHVRAVSQHHVALVQ